MTDETKAKVLEAVSRMPLPIVITLMLAGVIWLHHQSSQKLISEVGGAIDSGNVIIRQMEKNQQDHLELLRNKVIPALDRRLND